MCREEYINAEVDKFFHKYPAAEGDTGFDFIRKNPAAKQEYLNLFTLLRDNYEEDIIKK